MDYILHTCVIMSINVVIAMSLNLIVGTAGILSFAQAAVVAVGAYAGALAACSGLSCQHGGGLFVGALAGALTATLIGVASIRLRGEALVVGTVGLQLLATDILLNAGSVTGGSFGLAKIPPLITSGSKYLVYMAVVSIGLAVLIAVVFNYVQSSRAAQALRAIRESPKFAQSCGLQPSRWLVGACIVSGAAAGLVGALEAQYMQFIEPSMFGLSSSLAFIAMVSVGPRDRVSYAVVGAVLFTLLPEGLRVIRVDAAVLGNMRQCLGAVVILVVVVLRANSVSGHYEQ